MTDYIVEIIVGVLGLLITTFLIPYLQTLTAKIRNEKTREAVNDAMSSVVDKVLVVVQATSQTLVKNLIKNQKWDDAAKAEVRSIAVEQIKKLLTSQELAAIAASTDNHVDDWIIVQIESAIGSYQFNK